MSLPVLPAMDILILVAALGETLDRAASRAFLVPKVSLKAARRA